MNARSEMCQALSSRFYKQADELTAKVGEAGPARPRDFMVQAVTLVLENYALTAQAVLHRLLKEDAVKRLFVKEPTLERVRDVLSAGSRDPKNPRFIRVSPGKYKVNKKYSNPWRK